MISIMIFRSHDGIRGFQVSGHSGYDREGRDIVCAAVSSAVGLAECAVSDVLKIDAELRMEEKDAFFSLKIPASETSRDCRVIFEAFAIHVAAIRQEYPHYIDISEVLIP